MGSVSDLDPQPGAAAIPVQDGEPLDGELLDGELLEADLIGEPAAGGLPILAGPSELERARWIARPGVQAAAAAATGFVAGAATLALLRRRGAGRVASKVGAFGEALDQVRPNAPRQFPLRPGQTYIVQVRVLSPRAPE
jgi:hypothetical protein